MFLAPKFKTVLVHGPFKNHAHHLFKITHTTFSKSRPTPFQNHAPPYPKSCPALSKITHHPFQNHAPPYSKSRITHFKITHHLIQNHASPISKSRITLLKISHHFHIMFQFLVKIATHFFESQFKYHDFYFVVQ